MSLQISPTELAEQLRSKNPPHLLDVREPDEYELVALPNSLLIPLGELASHIDEIEKWRDEPTIVYCHHGVRSLHAISQLRQLGFSKLQNLAGGIDAWAQEINVTMTRY